MLIYQIKNNFNEMRYIGQTKFSIERRFKEHCKTSHCFFLSNAIKKHGKENFTIEIIDQATDLNELNAKESFWIKFLDTLAPNGYNLTTGGENTEFSKHSRQKLSESRKGEKNHNYGKHLSEEHRKKISDGKKGIKPTEATIKKMSESRIGEKNPNYGKKASSEKLKKMSDSIKGKKHTPETCKKMSESRKGEKNPFYGKKHPKELQDKINESLRRTRILKKIEEFKLSPQKLLFDLDTIE